jgi:uncharacterized DUF497 family protein
MFDWDPDKNEKNKTKHGIDFDDAKDVFNDPDRLKFAEQRPYEETRYITIGKAFLAIIRVVYTVTSKAIRIISARRTSKEERRAYLFHKFEKGTTDDSDE